MKTNIGDGEKDIEKMWKDFPEAVRERLSEGYAPNQSPRDTLLVSLDYDGLKVYAELLAKDLDRLDLSHKIHAYVCLKEGL